MNIQLLPSTFDAHGRATAEQRLTCFLVDDRVAVDAGSVALALTDSQHESLRDIIITHPHMDHIASLPIFIDDLFATLKEPVRVHATEEVIGLLERDVFNWTVYPRFSALTNDHGKVMEYVPFEIGKEFKVAHLSAVAIKVNHIVPTIGLIVSDQSTTIAFSSDTKETQEFWDAINGRSKLDALLIETSFPNAMSELAEKTGHLTPVKLAQELKKLNHNGLDVLTVHLKPSYREIIVEELRALGLPNLEVMEPGRIYSW